MAGAFQRNAFQNNAFQVDRTTNVTDSFYLPLPINCVLNGDQHYRVASEYDIKPSALRRKVTSQSSAVAQLSKVAPSYSVKVTSRGYD